MPRIRSIKPEHWEDKNLPKISLGAHLLWISMWNFSDDRGVIEHDCNLIKSNSFPRRKEIKPSHIKKWIEELVKQSFIIPFEYNDLQYLIHRTFDVHQKIDKPQKSKIDENIINSVRKSFAERSTNDTGTFKEGSTIIPRKDRIGEERKGEDKKGEDGIVLPKNFLWSEIYYKSFNQLKKLFPDLTETGFSKWKEFVEFILDKSYTDIFNCKFVMPQDFEKIDFPKSKWDETVTAILSTGIKPEHNLRFRIPKFITYNDNGTKRYNGGTSPNGAGISATSVIPKGKQYSGKL